MITHLGHANYYYDNGMPARCSRDPGVFAIYHPDHGVDVFIILITVLMLFIILITVWMLFIILITVCRLILVLSSLSAIFLLTLCQFS